MTEALSADFGGCGALCQINRRICLLAQLLFTELVECVELLGEYNILLKSTTGQLHPDDDRAVWNHHRHRSKVNLQVLR